MHEFRAPRTDNNFDGNSSGAAFQVNRVGLHEAQTRGERIADGAASGIGSWRFIIVQTVLVIIWVIANAIGIVYQWDPYPFILLNLMFSVQAAYTGPILLLAGNRQAARDRAMAKRDDEELGLLLTLQREQMEILQLLKDEQAGQADILRTLRLHIEAAAA
jgi:uncharacterized membrane protein